MNTLLGVGGEELQELVLHVGEVERAAAERGLVGLEVEHEVAVLDDLGTRAAARAPEQVAQARLELLRVERREAEVVEEVFAHLELGELRARHQQQHRLERAVALAQRAADAERAFGILVGARRPRPPTRRPARDCVAIDAFVTAFHG